MGASSLTTADPLVAEVADASKEVAAPPTSHPDEIVAPSPTEDKSKTVCRNHLTPACKQLAPRAVCSPRPALPAAHDSRQSCPTQRARPTPAPVRPV